MKVPKGLAGVQVTETSIAKSDADGALVYRGYPIKELADNASFEETAYLVLHGSLPTRSQLVGFTEGLASDMNVDPRVFRLMKDLGAQAHPMDVLRTACSAAGSIDDRASVAEVQRSLEANMAVLAANTERVPRGENPILPEGREGYASGLLRMLTGRTVDGYDLWAFERVLLFYMEHDLNASSFTVRVVASTLADPYAAATAGLSALKGPLHGGANEAAMKMLLKVGGPEKAKEFVEGELAAGRKVIGFGHRVYKKFDPRALLCKEYLGEMLRRRGKGDGLLKLCEAVEEEMMQRKGIPANLDYYAAPIFHLLGISIPLYTPIFAASRVFGWMAHYDEQVAENKLIRPDAMYTGRTDLKYVRVDDR